MLVYYLGCYDCDHGEGDIQGPVWDPVFFCRPGFGFGFGILYFDTISWGGDGINFTHLPHYTQ